MQLQELENYIQQLLQAWRFRDYCPNGLQFEGRSEVRRLITGVTANMALLEAAVNLEADAVLVHHGWFWKSEDARITGIKRRRIGLLAQHDISLLAYHLPLDAHPELGNNVELARHLGLEIEACFGEQDLGCLGSSSEAYTLNEWQELLRVRLGQAPLVIGEPGRPVRRVAWCTGAAQSYFQQALERGVDAFITGEISEPMVHLARESGVAYLAAGHHATERYGVQALGRHLAERFGLEHEFVDIPSPV